MKSAKFKIYFLLLLLIGCTSYQNVSVSELKAHDLIGHWKMDIEPYYIDINCAGNMAFLMPSNILYGDQKGSDFVITEITNKSIITGPIIRVEHFVEEWPHNENDQIKMRLEDRPWHKTKNYQCLE